MLYEEDYFHPTNIDITFEDVKLKKYSTNIIEKVRGLDSGYIIKNIEVMRKLKNGEVKRHIEKIEIYCSGDIGSYIRNAVSGQKMPHLVGSKDEDLYFSVIDVSGINKRKEGIKLFYDSPEQYETHFHTILNQKIKENWHNKFLKANTA